MKWEHVRVRIFEMRECTHSGCTNTPHKPPDDQRNTWPRTRLNSHNQVYEHARQELQIWIVEPLSRVVGQSSLNLYVPMPPCAALPLIHVAEPSLIHQSKQALHITQSMIRDRWPLLNYSDMRAASSKQSASQQKK